MKVGDIVKKVRGDWDLGKIGYVLKIKSNGFGTSLVTVIVDKTSKTWSGSLLEVINESR